LKEEALDRTVWRNRFGRGFGPAGRQNTEWTNTYFYLVKVNVTYCIPLLRPEGGLLVQPKHVALLLFLDMYAVLDKILTRSLCPFQAPTSSCHAVTWSRFPSFIYSRSKVLIAVVISWHPVT
jgi:hypothetical protein